MQSCALASSAARAMAPHHDRQGEPAFAPDHARNVGPDGGRAAARRDCRLERASREGRDRSFARQDRHSRAVRPHRAGVRMLRRACGPSRAVMLAPPLRVLYRHVQTARGNDATVADGARSRAQPQRSRLDRRSRSDERSSSCSRTPGKSTSPVNSYSRHLSSKYSLSMMSRLSVILSSACCRKTAM